MTIVHWTDNWSPWCLSLNVSGTYYDPASWISEMSPSASCVLRFSPLHLKETPKPGPGAYNATAPVRRVCMYASKRRFESLPKVKDVCAEKSRHFGAVLRGPNAFGPKQPQVGSACRCQDIRRCRSAYRAGSCDTRYPADRGCPWRCSITIPEDSQAPQG